MTKPTTAPKQTPKYDAPPAKRVRAIRTENNKFRLVEEEFAGPPTSTKVLADGVSGASAQERVKLWNIEHVGGNFYGDSGL